MTKIALLVFGSRTFDDYQLVHSYIKKTKPTIVIHGGAHGADSLADKAAKDLELTIEEYKANWAWYGKKAGFIRNRRMADRLIELREQGWEVYGVGFRVAGKSRGTDMMKKILDDEGIDNRIYY